MAGNGAVTDVLPDDELRTYAETFFVVPGQWADYKWPTKLAWQCVAFNADNADLVPKNEHGVYAFVIEPRIAQHPCIGYLGLIGKADSLPFRDRYRDYLAERDAPKGRPRVRRMLTKWAGCLYYYYAPVADAGQIAALEAALLDAFIPPFNERFSAKVGHARKAFS